MLGHFNAALQEVRVSRRAFNIISLSASAILLSLPSAVIAGEDAKTLFDGIYRADIARVTATPTFEDDLELAQGMLKVVNSTDTPKALLVVACHQIFDLAGRNEKGYPLAIEVMNQLSSRVPAERQAAQSKVLALYEEWYRQGGREGKAVAGKALIEHLTRMGHASAEDGGFEQATQHYQKALVIADAVDRKARPAILEKIQRLRTHRQLFERIAVVKRQFERNEENTAVADELIRLLVVELDDPGEARKYSLLAKPETQKLLLAATLEIRNLSKEDLMALGDWYHEFAVNTKTLESRRAMTRRATGYYRAFLNVHKENDLQRTKAQLTINKLESQLAQAAKSDPKSDSKSARPDRSANLLVLVDPAKDAVDGKWSIEGDSLKGEAAAYSRIAIPAEIAGDYEFEVEVRRVGGAGVLIFVLPLGDGQVAMGLGGENAKQASLGMLGGVGKFFDMTSAVGNNQWYRVQVAVVNRGGESQIEAKLDGKSILKWTGKKSDVRVSPMWRVLSPQVIGLGAMHSQVVFRNIHLRMTSGRMKPLRP